MKTLLFSSAFALLAMTAYADHTNLPAGKLINIPAPDSVKLLTDSNHTYYQKVINLDANIGEGLIYTRALEFMALKNFQQTYGNDEDGKLIFTTAQVLNTNTVYVGDDSDTVEPYNVQFSITVDMQNRKYRYTIDNVVFFRPTVNGDRRLTLHDMYVKATNTNSKRITKDAKKVIDSFERYLTTLTTELREGIEQKTAIYNSKF